MKRTVYSAILALGLGVVSVQGGAAYAASATEQEAVTLETLKEDLAPDLALDSLSADELYEKGQQYETGDGEVQWYAAAQLCYEAAESAGSQQAVDALSSLESIKQEMMENSEDGQGDVFDFFRSAGTAVQEGNFEQAYAIYYDDAFFFEDPVYRGIGSIADLVCDGKGVEQDIDKAIALYTAQAEILGNGKGYSNLGMLYEAETGTYPGIEQSFDTAVEYFRLSYEGDAVTDADFKGARYVAEYLESGYEHDDGSYEEPDCVKAEQAYLIGAEGNGRTYDLTSCYRLGTYYEEGRDSVEQDYEKAVTYYSMAVAGDHVSATVTGVPETYLALGRLYENGLGTEQNADAARENYESAKAAAQEVIDSSKDGASEAMQSVVEEAEAGLARLG